MSHCCRFPLPPLERWPLDKKEALVEEDWNEGPCGFCPAELVPSWGSVAGASWGFWKINNPLLLKSAPRILPILCLILIEKIISQIGIRYFVIVVLDILSYLVWFFLDSNASNSAITLFSFSKADWASAKESPPNSSWVLQFHWIQLLNVLKLSLIPKPSSGVRQ